MKALVTGGGGFLGATIVRQLRARGDDATVFARRRYPDLEALGAKCFQGDICGIEPLLEATKGVDVVFHTAALAGVWGPWRDYFSVNVNGTRNVLLACEANQVRRLVYTSTPSVVFEKQAIENGDESLPYAKRFLCHYAHTKAIAEREVLAANAKTGTLACALRPHLIWGPGDPHLIPRIVARARAGKLMQVGDGTNRVDLTHVDNAALAHLLAADALDANPRVAGNAYFISDGEPVNLWQWINDLLRLLGLPPVTRQISYRSAHRIGWLLEKIHGGLRLKREPRMTRFVAAQLAVSHYFNIRKAVDDLGYRPRPGGKAALDEMARRFKNHAS